MKAAHQVLLCVEETVYTAVFEEERNIELHQINLVQCTRNDFSCVVLLAVGIIIIGCFCWTLGCPEMALWQRTSRIALHMITKDNNLKFCEYLKSQLRY